MKVVFSAPLLFLLACTALASAAPALQQDEMTATASPWSEPQSNGESADRSQIIYVSNFDLDLPANKDARNLPGPVAPPASSNEPEAKLAAKVDGKPDAKREDTAAERGAKFVDFVSITLVRELERAGYTARRLQPGDQRPSQGIRISGVFAEPDDQNRWRRAMVGSQNVGPMALFVSIGNLARPDQALYTVVDPKSASPTIGPVITVSAYAPVARFPVPKTATEKTIRDTATSIVSDLTTLLHKNSAALTN